jgi:hypothetical protein
MPVNLSTIHEFNSSGIKRAREIAKDIRHEINTTIADEVEFTTLQYFCYFLNYQPKKYSHREEKLRILLNAGADPNVGSNSYNLKRGTPLQNALEHDAGIEFIELLLDAKADINFSEDKNGCSSIFWAAKLRRLEELKLLIDRGGNVNQLNNNSKTAIAEEFNKEEIEINLKVARLLLEGGAQMSLSLDNFVKYKKRLKNWPVPIQKLFARGWYALNPKLKRNLTHFWQNSIGKQKKQLMWTFPQS